MMDYDRAEHARYLSNNEELFGGRNHPEPDLTRAWVDMPAALPSGMFGAVLRWAETASIDDRPGRYTLTRAVPGGIWCNSDPLIMAVGRALEPEVSRLIGRRAWMSFGGINVHYRGVPTVRHRDMGFYRYLVSWPVAYDIDGGWPIHIERPATDGGVDVDRFDNASPRRALLFAGHDVQHWREPYPGQTAVSFFMRYTAFEGVRCHTQHEVDTLADAGVAELGGLPLSEEALALISPYCTSQRLVRPECGHLIFTELFSRDECREILRLRPDQVWPEWIAYRLRQVVADTGPAIIGGCAFAGHEHRLEIGLCTGSDRDDWHADLLGSPANRLRVVVCLSESGFGDLSFRETGPVRMRLGDAIIWPATREFKWRKSLPHLTALYGAPDDLLERTAARDGGRGQPPPACEPGSSGIRS